MESILAYPCNWSAWLDLADLCLDIDTTSTASTAGSSSGGGGGGVGSTGFGGNNPADAASSLQGEALQR